MKKGLSIASKVFTFLFIFIFITVLTLYLSMILIVYGPSENARNTFITTFLETGQFKFIVKLVMSEKQVEEIVNSNSLKELDLDVDDDLINTDNYSDAIEIEDISGSGFSGKMMVIHDPSRVSVATTYPFSEYGKTLDEIVSDNNALAGVNGGIYQSSMNKGGYPMGVVVSNGNIVWNEPRNTYYLIGLDRNNILQILSLDGLNSSSVEAMVQEKGIRDAVTFQETATGDVNHFVKLIINGEKRLVSGKGSGGNPRTAIGQRVDGTILILVTDGRGLNGHLGATAEDLIEIMEEYGAINAANLDGGSSSCMYYDNAYLMTSVTFRYSNSSWRLPEAFIISKEA